MYLNAVSCWAASRQSINTGNAIHHWNTTPSLTVNAHYCGHQPHPADREEDNTSSGATADIVFSRGIAEDRMRVGTGFSFVKYEPVLEVIPGQKIRATKKKNITAYHNMHLYTGVLWYSNILAQVI